MLVFHSLRTSLNRRAKDRRSRTSAPAKRRQLPDDIPLLELADSVVRGKMKLSPPQMRLLIELLPYHAPKLMAVGTAELNGNSFAELLDKAIERSQRKMIDVTPNPVQPHPADKLKGPMPRMKEKSLAPCEPPPLEHPRSRN